MDGPGQGSERIEHRGGVLVLERPEHEVKRPAAQERRQRLRDGARRVRVVRAVHVHISELLEPRGPARGSEPFLGVSGLAQPARFQESTSEGGVRALVMTGQRRLRAHVPCRTGVAECLVLPALESVIATRPPEPDAHLLRAPLQHFRRLLRLIGAHRRYPGLENTRLLRRDVRERRAEILRVLQSERADRAGAWDDDIGRIETPAQPDLDHRDVDLAEGEERHQRHDLEEGQPGIAERPGNPPAHFLEQLAGTLLGDGLARDADPLAEVVQVGARIEARAQPGRPERGFGKGAG